jgi:hypothetical protein
MEATPGPGLAARETATSYVSWWISVLAVRVGEVALGRGQRGVRKPAVANHTAPAAHPGASSASIPIPTAEVTGGTLAEPAYRTSHSPGRIDLLALGSAEFPRRP